jgi:hypothetical protein
MQLEPPINMSDALSTNSSSKNTRSLKDKLRSAFGRKSVDDTNAPRRKSSAGESVKSGRKSLTRASIDSNNTNQNPAFKTQAERIREQRENGPKIDKQTGERLDQTQILHSLAHESFDTVTEVLKRYELDPNRAAGEAHVASLDKKLWGRIMEELSLVDCACLALSSKVMLERVGPAALENIRLPDHAEDRMQLLHRLEDELPNHLFCFVCNRYHLRTMKGEEKLKPASVLNPLFVCPHATNNLMPQPRLRIATGRTLPYNFVQLALKGKKYGLDYGIEATTMARLWREQYEPRWIHSSRYFVFKGHLLMRVQSTCFTKPGLTPAGERMLLYSREDYQPYFSVCAHWRDGLLMSICKCALSHLPVPPEKSLQEGLAKVAGRRVSHGAIITLCSTCRPMRRCPACPTEYLVEVKLAEDRSEKDPNLLFKHAIVVTRWSDLGDGSSPTNPEWAAVTGALEDYDSLSTIGTRAISGTFESQTADTGPGQRILNLNPNDEHKGEDGHDWY